MVGVVGVVGVLGLSNDFVAGVNEKDEVADDDRFLTEQIDLNGCIRACPCRFCCRCSCSCRCRCTCENSHRKDVRAATTCVRAVTARELDMTYSFQ